MNFEELITRLAPKLRVIAKKLNGNFTFFDEEDLCQEAFFYLWQQNRNQRLDAKTDSYILQGCYFFLKNYIRKVYKRVDSHSVSLNDNINLENNRRSGNSFLEDSNKFFNALNVHMVMEDIVSSLDKREKDVFRLCLDGFTIREIGKILGVSHVMVVKIKKRIINKCKELKEHAFTG